MVAAASHAVVNVRKKLRLRYAARVIVKAQAFVCPPARAPMIETARSAITAPPI
jgi:hypothetical protein